MLNVVLSLDLFFRKSIVNTFTEKCLDYIAAWQNNSVIT